MVLVLDHLGHGVGYGTGLLLSASTGSAAILETAGDLITWAITQFTAIITWAIGNPYMIILLCMFIAGFAVSLLARVIYSL